MNNVDFKNIEVLEIDEVIRTKNDFGKIKLILLILIFLLVILIGLGLFFFLKFAKDNVNAEPKVENKIIELGTKKEDIKIKGCKLNFDEVNFDVIGEYSYKAKCNEKNYKATLKIVDTISPKMELKILNIKNSQAFKPEDFIVSVNDLSKIKYEFSEQNILDYSKKNGVYIIPITATDECNNSSTENGILLVTNVVANKFLLSSKIISTKYNATLKVTDRLGFNSSNYYINAIRIYEYIFNSEEEYLELKNETLKTNMIENIYGQFIYDDNLKSIKLIKELNQQDLDVLSGNFPSIIDDISKLYYDLGYNNKIEF